MASRYLNFNTVVLSLIGLLLIAKGAWSTYRFRDYVFGSGLFLLGAGIIIFGLTNGFSDPTPRGRMLFKIAVPSLLLGAVITAYSMRFYFMF
ncbi:MAG: hypothetical protein R2681_02805 [Pyrinomonadaceae bacterium]